VILLKKNFIYYFLIIFSIISITTIYSAQGILPSSYDNLYIKQIIWYLIGFGIMFLIKKIGKFYIYKICFVLYIVFNVLLLGLLFFGTEINGAKCWYNIFGFGFQPSEFMKIILIIILGIMIDNFRKKKKFSVKQEFKFLCKVFVIVLIPSVLTFLEPDTGVVLIYFIIMFSMLFISGIRYRWFIISFSVIGLFLGFILISYYFFNDFFVSFLGSSFSLRLERILSWHNNTGYQLTNGLSSIGAGGLFGYGFNNTPLYFPEAQTDFIFAVFASNYGFIGSLFLIILLLIFDLKLVALAKRKRGINRYIVVGMIAMLFYQQIQNIGMTLGLLPITGITLPFLSYGGSSLISYFIIMGFCI